MANEIKMDSSYFSKILLYFIINYVFICAHHLMCLIIFNQIPPSSCSISSLLWWRESKPQTSNQWINHGQNQEVQEVISLSHNREEKTLRVVSEW